jgi:hypothetical protein
MITGTRVVTRIAASIRTSTAMSMSTVMVTKATPTIKRAYLAFASARVLMRERY